MSKVDARDCLALACDYDRTLTDERLVVRDSTKAALAQARAAGRKVLVVSGRSADFLLREVGDVVDLVVAENGAFLVDPATHRAEPLFRDWPGPEALAAMGVDLEHGTAMASADVRHAAVVEAFVRRMDLPVRLERNVDRIMVLPRGVEKAAGFLAALERLGVPRERAAAAGDGENDVSLLTAAGWPVAVANAVPEVRKIAREVTRGWGGDGVREWILERWLV